MVAEAGTLLDAQLLGCETSFASAQFRQIENHVGEMFSPQAQPRLGGAMQCYDQRKVQRWWGAFSLQSESSEAACTSLTPLPPSPLTNTLELPSIT